jgi:intraflagellar transport protein 56
LERLDPSPDYWEGKRGACVGAFKEWIGCPEDKELFQEIIALLRSSPSPQVDYICRVMKNVIMV